jgi:hypothetical protein
VSVAAKTDEGHGIDASVCVGADISRHLGIGLTPAWRIVEELPVADLGVGGDATLDLAQDGHLVETVRQADIDLEGAVARNHVHPFRPPWIRPRLTVTRWMIRTALSRRIRCIGGLLQGSQQVGDVRAAIATALGLASA